MTYVLPADDHLSAKALIAPQPSGKARPDAQRLPRCCDEHPDWPTLAEHLLVEFPEVGISDIVRQVDAARDAVRGVGLDGSDALQTAELIARQQLMLLAGKLPEMARLDPERHRRHSG